MGEAGRWVGVKKHVIQSSTLSPSPAVLPSLVVSPATEVGLHSRETLQLSCSTSGFPQPMVVWLAAEDVRIDLKLKEHVKLTAVDEYTVRGDLVIENTHPDMSGSYVCAACYSDMDGECEVTENLPKTFVSVAVYGEVGKNM